MKMLLLFCVVFFVGVKSDCVEHKHQMTCVNRMKIDKIFPTVTDLNLIDLVPRAVDLEMTFPRLQTISILGSTRDYCDRFFDLEYRVLGCQG